MRFLHGGNLARSLGSDKKLVSPLDPFHYKEAAFVALSKKKIRN